MISTDRKAFEVNSAVRERLIEYGELVSKLAVIIFVKQNLGFRSVQISAKTSLQPTNSRTRWSYILTAYRLGKILPRPDLITAQDPFETGLVGWYLTT